MEVDVTNSISSVTKRDAPVRTNRETPQKVDTGQAAVEAQPADEEIKQRVAQIMQKFSSENQLKMYYDQDINEMIVVVVDGNTGKVIRQVPPSELVQVAKDLQQYLGRLVNRRI